MHPILARGGRLALYLGVWIVAGVLLSSLIARPGGPGSPEALAIALPLAVTYAFFCLSAWYVSRSAPLATSGTIRLVTTALTAALITSGAWLFLARVWIEVLARRGIVADAAASFDRNDTILFGFGLLLYLLSLAGGYLLASFEVSREAERRALEGQVLAREAELRSLRAQIDPHFLFNSLHSISALTTMDPQAARRMCILLADFLRESLALGAEDRIPLNRELDLVKRYLEIERVRFGDRLHADLDPGGADSYLVPPLLLQPIVENAVTHGIAHMIEGGTVRVGVSRGDGTVTFTIENPCDPDRPRGAGTGLGLSNVRARLRALHSDDARVRAGEEGGVWRVEIVLPAQLAADDGHERTT
jgi:two-component system sensor histidine kinase AlgZ